jgi:anhydro-N-acetylmuramic acid kinase
METTYRVIGLMSGTSLDGLDMAYCELTYADDRWQFAIPVAETRPYNEVWRHTLSRITEVSGEALILADQQLGTWMGQAVKEFMDQHTLDPQLVAAHGHTVFHQPERGLTYQMGNGFALQAACQQPVVMNFRNYDVALGGQGAPLVPVGDHLLFGDYDFCLNLGGIANVTTELHGRRVAYDIGVANMVSNYFVQQEGHAYDDNGKLAARGQVDQSLVDHFNGLNYYAAPFPKSLGYEWVRDHLIRPLEASSLTLTDRLATVTQHATQQIARDLWQLLDEKKQTAARVLVTGGGAFNGYFMQCLRRYSGEAVTYVIPDAQLVSFKEALVFALLGVLRVRGEINCLASVTGAAHDHSAGVVYGSILPNIFS